jgi:hypothetical protein
MCICAPTVLDLTIKQLNAFDRVTLQYMSYVVYIAKYNHQYTHSIVTIWTFTYYAAYVSGWLYELIVS